MVVRANNAMPRALMGVIMHLAVICRMTLFASNLMGYMTVKCAKTWLIVIMEFVSAKIMHN